jgi:hypothetical protein
MPRETSLQGFSPQWLHSDSSRLTPSCPSGGPTSLAPAGAGCDDRLTPFCAGTRGLVARKWTYRAGQGRPAGVQALRALVVRMAIENPTLGYTRMQGALKNLGHHVGRSTIARILRAEGIPPGRQRPMTWRTFRQAH